MISSTLRTWIDSVKKLFHNLRALLILIAMYALLLLSFYIFVSTREATVWQVMVTYLFLVLLPAEFFALQATIIDTARELNFSPRRIAGNALKIFAVTIPVLIVGWVFWVLLDKIQLRYHAPVLPVVPASALPTAQPIYWPTLLIATIRFLLFGVAFPLMAIQLWIEVTASSLRESFAAGAKPFFTRIGHAIARAFSNESVFTYGVGLILFLLIPYGLLFAPLTIKGNKTDFAVFILRLVLAFAFALVVTNVAAAQTDVGALVERAVAYVERFQQNFGSVVSEERYEQRLRRIAVPGSTSVQQRGGGGPQETTLVSDFLLVEVKGEGWLPFRDVFERDGKPVRDREERLASIFLKGGRNAFDQARAVMDEGARYNIGNINRNINTPTLTLAFLTERHRQRFEFKLGKRDDSDPGIEIEFREKGRPTFVATTGGRDLPVSGRFWINESDGTVLRSELDALDTGVEAHITVTYQKDDGIGLFVPARMEERYRRPRDPIEVYGVATYSRFRRFQVSTSEELAK